MAELRVVREDILIGELGIGDAHVLEHGLLHLALDVAAGEGPQRRDDLIGKGRGHQRGPVERDDDRHDSGYAQDEALFVAGPDADYYYGKKNEIYDSSHFFAPFTHLSLFIIYLRAARVQHNARFSEAQDCGII